MNLNDAPAQLPHLSIAQLEYLVAVDEHQTWAKAGQAVGVSASALSQGLAELQRRLGLSLFERDGRRQIARPEAAPVVAYARRVLAETRDLSLWAERLRSGSTGRLSVGMIDAAAIHWFGDVLAGYRTDHPDVDLRLTVAPSAQLLDRLQSGIVDVAVCVLRDSMHDQSLSWTSLVTEPLYVYAPPGQERKNPTQWGPWVSFPSDSHSRESIGRALRQLGADFDVVAESSQPDVLREMVYLGVGWTVLPAVEAEHGPHGLQPARKTPITQRQLVLARRPNSHPNPAADELGARLQAAAERSS